MTTLTADPAAVASAAGNGHSAAPTTEIVTKAPEAKPVTHQRVEDDSPFANLLDTSRFEHMWRIAQMFSKSELVPKHFQGKPESCWIACQMAVRLGVDPFMFMQNTYIVGGKPGMEAKLAIALINARGPFTGPIQFEHTGEGEQRQCRAYAKHKVTGEVCSVTVTFETAKKEGWTKNPKWDSMRDQMLAYRSGAWFGRLYAPECLMGMQLVDELEDVKVSTPKLDELPTGRSSFNIGAEGKPVKLVENMAAQTPGPETSEQPQTFTIPEMPDPSVKPGARFLYLIKVARQAGSTLDDAELNKAMTDFCTANKVAITELKDADKFLALWEAFRNVDWAAQQAA